MWQNEKKFGQYVMNKLKKAGYRTIRIESASTISGMPDLYIDGYGDDYFIELKNNQFMSIYDIMINVKWRPGQQAWGVQYTNNHKNIYDKYVREKHSWTFVGCKDGVLCICMGTYIEDETWNSDIFNVFKFTKEQFQRINLGKFLWLHSYTITPVIKLQYTFVHLVGAQIARLLTRYNDTTLGYKLDLPDTKILVQEFKNERLQYIKDNIESEDEIEEPDTITMGWLERECTDIINKYATLYYNNKVKYE